MSDDRQSHEQDERDAIMRLASSHDGALIRRYFRRVLESCRATEETSALQRHEGARILARDFLVHMDRGIEGPRERTGDDPILKPSANAVGHRPRGAARRVQPLADLDISDSYVFKSPDPA